MITRYALWPICSAVGLLNFPQSGFAKEVGQGVASYYGKEFAGKRTASGETFNPSALTAAHRTLPFGSRIRVTNLANGKDVVVRVNDRGPWGRGRIIDISHAAAKQIGLLQRGTGQVKLSLID